MEKSIQFKINMASKEKKKWPLFVGIRRSFAALRGRFREDNAELDQVRSLPQEMENLESTLDRGQRLRAEARAAERKLRDSVPCCPLCSGPANSPSSRTRALFSAGDWALLEVRD